jgi:hypothetical protein
MPVGRTRRRATTKSVAGARQVNVRVEGAFYRALEALARQDQRSVSQAARQLMEEGLRHRTRGSTTSDDTPSRDVARLAMAGGAYDWLADEPDLYGADSGEPA